MFLATLLGIAAVASAAPPHTARSPGVSLPLNAPRTPAGMGGLEAVRNEHKRVLAKYGYASALQTRDIDLKSWGAGYSVSVDVGTPPQTFDVIPDTGSFDFWLIGTCDNTTECGNSSVFRTAASSSFQATDMPFEAGPYADGGLQRGTWGYDQVGVGGQVVNSSVGISNETLNWGLGMDGIMGFGPDTTSEQTKPWWFNVLSAWEDKQFGMHLGRVPTESKAREEGIASSGDLTLGGVNRALFTGLITYYPVDAASGHWQIPMRAVVNGESVGTEAPALIDSGTSRIVGPNANVEAFYAALPTQTHSVGGGYYLYKDAPLKAGFSFGGDVYPLDDDDMCVLRGNSTYFAEIDNNKILEDGDWCMGAIMGTGSLNIEGSVDTGAPVADREDWIVGGTFMKNVYTAFRAEPLAVGFAPLTPEANKKYPREDNVVDPGAAPMGNATTTDTPTPSDAAANSGAHKCLPSLTPALLVVALALVL